MSSARLPAESILYATGDSLVLRREDELSVEYVEVHGLAAKSAEVVASP